MLAAAHMTSLKAAALLGWTFVSMGCGRDPISTPAEVDERTVTRTILVAFLNRQPANYWPVIYLSDQYLTFAIDSGFLRQLPDVGASYVVARRSEAEASPDIVKNGGLFLEPLAPRSQGDASVFQGLNFSATADFGGEYLYRLKWVLIRWTIVKITAVWLI